MDGIVPKLVDREGHHFLLDLIFFLGKTVYFRYFSKKKTNHFCL